jgi:hypothetical protein
LTAAVLGLKTNQPSYVCQSLAILLRFRKYKKIIGQLFYKSPFVIEQKGGDLLTYIITAPNEEKSTESTESTESMEGKNRDLSVTSTALFQHLIYGSKWRAKHALFKRDPIKLYDRNSSRLVFSIGKTVGYNPGVYEGVQALIQSSQSSGSGWICHSCHSPTTIIDTCLFCGASKIESEKAQSKLDRHRKEQARLAQIEAVRIEEERLAAIETARLAAIEADRVVKERLAAIEAERLEAERIEKKRLEAERIEKERLEAERLEAERIEKERLDAIEAERLEAERIEKERLDAIEAERLEAERIEKERLDAIEAERLETERIEIEQQGLFDEKLRASNMTAEQKVTAGIYYDDGLQPELIFPLMAGIIDEHTVVQFRNKGWIKQYDLDDPFIMMILEGKISIPSAEEFNILRSDHETLFSFTIKSIEAAEGLDVSLVIKSLNRLIEFYQEQGCSNVENAVLSTILGIEPYQVLQLSESKFQEKGSQIDSGPMDELLKDLRTEFDIALMQSLFFDSNRESPFINSKIYDQILWLVQANEEWKASAIIGLGYIIQGLSNQFVNALMVQHRKANNRNIKSLIKFWFAKWRKQYSDDDYLIQAVLNQTISESMGSKLNQKRSNHELLVYNIIQNPNLYEWGMMLLEAGFDEHPEAVLSALKGGSPLIISELKGIKADPLDLPPPIKVENIIAVLPPIEQRNATTNVGRTSIRVAVHKVAKTYTVDVLRQECERHGVDPYRSELGLSTQLRTKAEMVTAILESDTPFCDYEFCVWNHQLV